MSTSPPTSRIAVTTRPMHSSSTSIACVADHIAVRVIADDRVVLATPDRLDELVGHLARAHLRFEIVGRDLRRRHEYAVLAGIRLLDAAVEEVGDVRIFLRLGNAQLF